MTSIRRPLLQAADAFLFISGCHLQIKLPKHLCFGSFFMPESRF